MFLLFAPHSAGCVRLFPAPDQLWDLRNTASPLREFTGHTQDTTACVFLDTEEDESRGGRWRESQGGVGTADRNRGCGVSPPPPSSASTSHRMIATASKDGTIKIYDRDSGEVCHPDMLRPEPFRNGVFSYQCTGTLSLSPGRCPPSVHPGGTM